jgi:hypothetical protein
MPFFRGRQSDERVEVRVPNFELRELRFFWLLGTVLQEYPEESRPAMN